MKANEEDVRKKRQRESGISKSRATQKMHMLLQLLMTYDNVMENVKPKSWISLFKVNSSNIMQSLTQTLWSRGVLTKTLP